MERIDQFWGEYRFLSNFFIAPFEWRGEMWMSVEHAYQAMKCCDEDEETRSEIRNAESPGKAKRLSKSVTVRPDWSELRLPIMRELLEQKFGQHPELAQRLAATHPAELVEANTWCDNFWGDCTCPECTAIEGANHLGKMLMEIRSQLT